jgi:hypothetical protein
MKAARLPSYPKCAQRHRNKESIYKAMALSKTIKMPQCQFMNLLDRPMSKFLELRIAMQLDEHIEDVLNK